MTLSAPPTWRPKSFELKLQSVIPPQSAAMPMTSGVTETNEQITIEHRLVGRDRIHTIRAVGAKPAMQPSPDSAEQFFKEHQWGFGRTRRGATLCYEVRHPTWSIYPVRDFRIDLDWSELYGPEWEFLAKAEPDSTVLAAGSAVAVYPKGRIRA